MSIAPPRQMSWRRTTWRHPEWPLAAVAAAAWLALVTLHDAAGPGHVAAQRVIQLPDHGMRGHHVTSFRGLAGHQFLVSDPPGAPTLLVSVGLWTLMATAMMLPGALPAARSISLNGKWSRRQRGPGLFAFGYLVVWASYGVLLLSVGWLTGPGVAGPLAISGALVMAAAWEWTRWKRLCLRACHRVRSLPPDGWRADRAAVREGIRNGMWCTGSCGPMMLPMALAPHSVGMPLMFFLFVVVSAEKLLTRTVNHLRLVAGGLALAGIVVLFAPAA